MRSYKVYDEEFKREAIKLAKTSTKSKAEIAKDLGVLPSTFYAWLKKSEIDKDGNIITDSEFTRLKKELKDVKM
ncbi:MAG: transposase [bacterium]|nr:transposase [bacterium]